MATTVSGPAMFRPLPGFGSYPTHQVPRLTTL